MTLLEQFREFLVAFHERYPGGTARSLAELRSEDGRTSYRVLADAALEGGRSDERILEMGCGDGILLAEIAHLMPDAKLTGIDLIASDIAIARERLPHATFVTGDFLTYSFDRASFDAIVSHLVFMLSGPLEPVLERVRGALASGGRFAFVTDDLSAPPTFFAELIHAAMNAVGVESATTPFKPIVDLRLYDRETLANLLADYGLELKEYAPHVIAADLSLSELWEMMQRMYQIGTLNEAQQATAKAAIFSRVGDTPARIVLPFRLVTATRTSC